MGNITWSIFSFFVGELGSVILAIFIKDDKKRIWILVAGTIFSGVLAFSFQGDALVIPKFNSFMPTARPSATSTFTPSLISSPVPLDLSDFIYISLLPNNLLDSSTTPNWTVFIVCYLGGERCGGQLNYLIYGSSSDLSIDSSGWEYIETVDGYFHANSGYWYKVVLKDPPTGKYGGSARFFCCSGN